MPEATATAGVVLIGYSGHAWVVADCLLAAGYALSGYCERSEAVRNPYQLPYLGFEGAAETLSALVEHDWFVAIGDNALRARVQQRLTDALGHAAVIARHPSAVVSARATIGAGTLVGPLAVLNPAAQLGAGVICNTGAIIEHECVIDDFAHIGPGAVLSGNVTVGARAFVGAGVAVRQGIHIGADALVGAGAVVVKDIPAGARVVGNPTRLLPSA
jgi:sugar O-acyltransferase (sialic acid O-acetyltransferase NeuD family)